MTSDAAQIDALHVKAQAEGAIAQNPEFKKQLEQARIGSDTEKQAALRVQSHLYQLSSDIIDRMKQDMPKTYEQYRVQLASIAELETALGKDRSKQLRQQTGSEFNAQSEAYKNLSLEGRVGETVGKIRQDIKWQDIPERLWGRLFDSVVNEIRVDQAVANRPEVIKIQQ